VIQKRLRRDVQRFAAFPQRLYSNSALIPQRFHSDSSAIPQRFRSDSAATLQLFRSDSAAILQRSRSGSPAILKRFQNYSGAIARLNILASLPSSRASWGALGIIEVGLAHFNGAWRSAGGRQITAYLRFIPGEKFCGVDRYTLQDRRAASVVEPCLFAR
jgi:hypothetical protein